MNFISALFIVSFASQVTVNTKILCLYTNIKIMIG